MNLEDYKSQAQTIDQHTNAVVNTMLTRVQKAIRENKDELFKLTKLNGFCFIDRHGEKVELIGETNIGICKINNDVLLFNTLTDKIELLTLKDNSDGGYYVASQSELDNIFLKKYLAFSGVYEDIYHVVGLNGLLEADLQYRQEKQLRLKRALEFEANK